MRTRTRTVAVMTAAVSLLALPALPAAADHIHYRETGSGCVLLAAKGGERFVHADQGNRAHPLHANVHLGRAGNLNPANPGRIGVAYLGDGSLHGDAASACGGRFVNAHLAP